MGILSIYAHLVTANELWNGNLHGVGGRAKNPSIGLYLTPSLFLLMDWASYKFLQCGAFQNPDCFADLIMQMEIKSVMASAALQEA